MLGGGGGGGGLVWQKTDPKNLPVLNLNTFMNILISFHSATVLKDVYYVWLDSSILVSVVIKMTCIKFWRNFLLTSLNEWLVTPVQLKQKSDLKMTQLHLFSKIL